MKNAVGKDMPVSTKAPRRQRSSRFHITEKVELERLPAFKDVAASERQDIFIRKIQQCNVLFDFNDALSDLKCKEIKRHTLRNWSTTYLITVASSQSRSTQKL
ncbi:hypothetical protein BASA83_009051 [Batrachochytrium salamandrivorans]|nr:hypothetical protein BASA83_009051 [Batrachochytrium salamandrivorans]